MSRFITAEDLEQLIRFAEDDRIDIEPALIEGLNALHGAVMRNTVRHLTGARKRNAMLQDRLNRYKEREMEKIAAGEFKETDLDSAIVANGILYQLQTKGGYQIGKQKVNLILFEMYSSWLHSNKKHLCEEYPVAQESGPRFWRAFSEVDPSKKVPYSEWQKLYEKSGAIADFCENAVEKYGRLSNEDLENKFKKTKAYKNASKENNGGKWNKRIADQDIYAWRESLKP